jgi:hypothetical protein
MIIPMCACIILSRIERSSPPRNSEELDHMV